MKDRLSTSGTAFPEARKGSDFDTAAQPSRPTILLTVAGLTPQVITETLYCLVRESRPPVAVRDIRVVTTQLGAERVRELLLSRRHGMFHRFCKEFALPAGSIRFDPSCILVPQHPSGKPLEDVRTPAENLLVADYILSLVRDLTRDEIVSLHCSVAGGRKTMGLFLGIAFQLFARPHDRLSHVLVWPPEIEGHQGFFYPPPRPTTYTVNGRAIHSRDIQVELAEIPVLLLRERLQAVELERYSYSALIAHAQQELDREVVPPPLILDSKSRSLRVESHTIRLTPLEFSVYSILASRRAACGRDDCPGCERCSLQATAFLDVHLRQEIVAAIEKLGVRDERARTLLGWVKGGDERFLEVRSRLNRKIRDALGLGGWVACYQITARRTIGTLSRYHIPLKPTHITLG